MATHYAVDVEAIIGQWGSTCYLCGGEVKPDAPFGPSMLNVDHIVPLSRDGGDYIQNMRVVHYACNLRKGTHLVCPHCVEPITAPHTTPAFGAGRGGGTNAEGGER